MDPMARGGDKDPGDKDPDQRAICKRITRMDFEIPTTIPEEARDLIRRLLVKEGEERLALRDVLRSDFLVKWYYQPNKLEIPGQKGDPTKRPRDLE